MLTDPLPGGSASSPPSAAQLHTAAHAAPSPPTALMQTRCCGNWSCQGSQLGLPVPTQLVQDSNYLQNTCSVQEQTLMGASGDFLTVTGQCKAEGS